MKKALFFTLLAILALVVVINKLCNIMITDMKSMESNIGSTIVVSHDTLTVTSFSYFSGEYILNNGGRVATSFFEMNRVPDSLICIYKGESGVWIRDTSSEMKEGFFPCLDLGHHHSIEYKILPKSRFKKTK